MKDDLVSDLRDVANDTYGHQRDLANEAADAIEDLQRQLAEARAEVESEIVTWLRKKAATIAGHFPGHWFRISLADDIERGEHIAPR